MHIVHIGGHSSVGQRPSSIGRALVTAIHLDCLHVVMTMTMPMMTLAFRISIRWKYMYQDVERVLTNSDTYLQ